MPEPIPGHDAWKLDNGPYEDDGEPEFSTFMDGYWLDPIEAHEPDEEDEIDSCCGLWNCRDCRPENFDPIEAHDREEDR